MREEQPRPIRRLLPERPERRTAVVFRLLDPDRPNGRNGASPAIEALSEPCSADEPLGEHAERQQAPDVAVRHGGLIDAARQHAA